MFSVIIPTMWRSEWIWISLNRLEKCPEVGEIILIDNDNSSSKKKEFNNDKINYICEISNTYVNPSWNKGVKISKYDNICVLNDDLAFNTELFNFVKPHIHKGVIGQHVSNYDKWNTDFHPQIEQMEGRDWGWGCLFFIHKENWIEIPDDLLIACGDDYLTNNVKGGAWKISGNPIEYTQISITSLQSKFLEQQKKDIETYNIKYK
jgi:hypothetical protein